MNDANINFQIFDVHSHWILESEKRMNAGYYAEDIISANIAIEKLIQKGIEVKPLKELFDNIFWPGRFKRRYASAKQSIPFLTPTEVFAYKPRSRKYVFGVPENTLIKKDWILITRSGTVGRNIISTQFLEKYAISDDLIRIVPSKHTKYGYIYAYLNTWMGQALLSKNRYGATVKHIEPHHVETILVPILNEIEDEIHQRILQVQKLREEAQYLSNQAEQKLYSNLGLEAIDEDGIEYLGGKFGTMVNAFEVQASRLNNRFDASYHVPIIHQIEANLDKVNYDVCKVGDYIESIIIPPRFKRPYVRDPSYGVRYIRPSDLPLIKTFEELYLSKKFKNSEAYRLSEGEILVVTDGTIGWVSIVTPIINGNYGSNNFARIRTTSNLNAGYLLVYLQSPYGQYQLKREIFGGVIDHLIEDHILNIKIPIPKLEIQEEIGKLAIDAYTKKDEANKIEKECIKRIEDKMRAIGSVS